MGSIQVVGIGLTGGASLTPVVLAVVEQATLLVGSQRHLDYFPTHPGDRLVLGDLYLALQSLKTRLATDRIVVLVSGDPLFFGLGRLLLAEFPPDQLTFYPHLSSVQLAFNRLKLPWQDACMVSAHGRSLEDVLEAVRQGVPKLAVLTDQMNTPSAIAQAIKALELPQSYQVWVCENLGSPTEKVTQFSLHSLIDQQFSPLNVVVLIRQDSLSNAVNLDHLPLLGIPDSAFLSFSDRPGLMTKREIRVLILGQLQLQPNQIVWDIGAGTGSVTVEIARLCPTSRIYAIEKTAAGIRLIEENCRRFGVKNVSAIYGSAPEMLYALPTANRIFIGGTGGNLSAILSLCRAHLAPQGILVMAIATLEHLTAAITVLQEQGWTYQLLQTQLARSVPVAQLTRFSPLNPVTILTAQIEQIQGKAGKI